MLEVHPPDEAAHSWKDFFIHIATIVVGLIIAVGLEQSVEAIHHHHQRTELVEQMRDEAEYNLHVIEESQRALETMVEYNQALKDALLAAKVSGNFVDVQGVQPPRILATINSPSQGVWHAAQAGGTAVLLPPEQVKLYDRADFSAREANQSEDAMYVAGSTLASECVRAKYRHKEPAVSRITLTSRDSLLFDVDQAIYSINALISRLALFQGDTEAVAKGATSMDQVHAYQREALSHLKANDSYSTFYGQ
jgi:hypothetical protein